MSAITASIATRPQGTSVREVDPTREKPGLGQRGLAVVKQHFMTDPGGEHVVDFLKPG